MENKEFFICADDVGVPYKEGECPYPETEEERIFINEMVQKIESGAI